MTAESIALADLDIDPASVPPPADPYGDVPHPADDAGELAGHAGALDSPAERTVADIGAEFWAAKPMLTHIRQCAHARIASPWAVLGEVLSRALTFVPPKVQLPPTIGGNGSLNLFFAEVATSGVGKGAAAGAADDGIEYRCEVRAIPAGSGEGIVDAFATTDSKGEQTWHSYANHITIPEVDHLAAEMERSSSTIGVYLRQGFMGEGLGGSYRTKTSRAFLPKHSYRLTMTVGVQPGRAGALLAEAAGGTPQRFVWLPATDPTGPGSVVDVPRMPKPRRWLPPSAVEVIPFDSDGEPVLLAICDTAREKIITDQIARQHECDVDPLETHANFVRLKVAAALAFLCHNPDEGGPLPEITDEYWHLAGLVMEVSSITRRRVADTLSAEVRKQNEAAGYAEAVKARIVANATDRDAVAKTAGKIAAKLDRIDGWISRGKLRASLSSSGREYFDEATELLIEQGRTVRRNTTPGHGEMSDEFAAAR